MNTNDSIFQKALSKLLTEIFDGPPGSEAYLFNPGDPGLLRQLDSISATIASKRPMPGKTTIAAHVDHVPWAGADWNASWQRTTVTQEQWQTLRAHLRRAAQTWQDLARIRNQWDDITAAGALSSAAHTAYHVALSGKFSQQQKVIPAKPRAIACTTSRSQI